MFDGLSLKLVEAGLVLVAGALFGWWQLRDLKREQKKTRARRAALESAAGQPSAHLLPQPYPHRHPPPYPPDSPSR